MYKKFDIIFGIIIISVFALFLWVLINPFITSFSAKSYKLKASFSSAVGINQGTAVKLSGIKIGEVNKLYIDPQTYLVKMELKIKSNYKLPIDSIVSIKSEGLLGGKYIEIKPGFEEEMFTDGSEFEDARGALNLEDLISTFASGIMQN